MSQININTDAAVVMTNKLEKMHRSALPLAIRSSLNSTAFYLKQRALIDETKKEFVNRSPNFFKSKSRVVTARGFSVNSMKSMVGMVGKDQAVEDLNQQEHGGDIKGRSFIPMDQARTSKSSKKNVSQSNRMATIQFGAIKRVRKGQKRKLMIAVHKAGVGKKIIYGKTMFAIKSIGKGAFRATPIYSFKKNRSVRVKATHFMKKASLRAIAKMPRFYNEAGKKQIKRLMSK